MSEYWFYHLEASSLEEVLPDLLEKAQAKGWRVLVKLPASRLAEMDNYLWTYKETSFLPHGRDDEPLADQQPILLTATASTSGAADCVILIDGQDIEVMEAASRCIIMINGRSESDVAAARAQWKQLKNKGETLSYWQQSATGRWEKRA